MGIISRTVNFIMSLVALAVLALIAYVFFYGKWRAHQEQQYQEQRESIISEASQASRERGLGDLAPLRQGYLRQCPAQRLRIMEAEPAAVCEAMADALVARSVERRMTLPDFLDLQDQLCRLDIEREDEDPDEYCPDEYVTEQVLSDALAMGLCALERAWLFDTEYEQSITKRGTQVYIAHDLRVDCETRLFNEWDYEGFFEGITEEEDWSPTVDALYEAVDSGDEASFRALFDAHSFGHDEQVDRWLLNLVVEYPRPDDLTELLKRTGGQVNFMRNYYDQPLSRAIDAGNAAAALALLDAGADPIRPYEYGATPIVDAATRGLFEVVKRLVAEGADVDGVVGSESLNFGEPLLWAAWNGHEEVALWLLENGAGIAPEVPAQYPLWSDHQLLDYAVNGGDLVVVEALVARGARSRDPVRLFEGILAGGSPEVLRFLLAQGYTLPEDKDHDRIYDAVVDVIKEEGRGRIEDGAEMFEILLDRGLDMANLTESGWNYGHQAVIHYAPPTVIRNDDDPRSAVVHAHRLRFVKRVIDEVLADGIDINQRYESETMLMRAADGGQPELTAYLLELGADASLTDEQGRTALDIAVREGRRLTAFWDEDEQLKARFSGVIEILGGRAELLEPQQERSDGQ